MSKLESIFNTVGRMAEPNGLVTSDIEWAKEQTKALMLELINTTSTMSVDGKVGNVEWVHYEQLRQKVIEL